MSSTERKLIGRGAICWRALRPEDRAFALDNSRRLFRVRGYLPGDRQRTPEMAVDGLITIVRLSDGERRTLARTCLLSSDEPVDTDMYAAGRWGLIDASRLRGCR